MSGVFSEKNAVLVAVIIAPHGIRGTVAAESLSDNPRRFRAGAKFFDESGCFYTLDEASQHKGRLLLRFRDVHDRDAAEKLRGKKIYIDASQSEPLPEGNYYHYQIIGMKVQEDGVALGSIMDILPYSANDVFIIKTPDGQEILIPALKSVVKKVDVAAGIMDVKLPEGLDRTL